jgi:hypothetical protein
LKFPPKLQFFPVYTLLSGKIGRDWFAQDCLHSHFHLVDRRLILVAVVLTDMPQFVPQSFG